MSDDIKKNISDINIWKRALFMLLFALLYGLAEVVIWAVVLLQFFIVLFTGSKNERLLEFGQNLTTFIYQIILFQTFNTERRPFPFGDWPDGTPEEARPGDEDDPEDPEDNTLQTDISTDDTGDSKTEQSPGQSPEQTIELESESAELEDEPESADDGDGSDPADDAGDEDKPAS